MGLPDDPSEIRQYVRMFVSDAPLEVGSLTRLQDLWTSTGSDLAARLANGLSGNQVEQLLADQGLVAPLELQAWWSWQNGAVDGSWRSVSPAPGRFFLSLHEALERRTLMMTVAEQAADDWDVAPNQLWAPEWLPILRGENDVLACDCAATTGAASPIRWINNHDMTPDELAQVRLPSIGALVRVWIDCLEAGLYRYETDSQSWEYDDWDEVPQAMRETGAVR